MSPVFCEELDIGEEATVGNRMPLGDFVGFGVVLGYLECIGVGVRGSYLLEDCDVRSIQRHGRNERSG